MVRQPDGLGNRNDNGKNQATLRIGDVGEIIIRNSRRPEGGRRQR